MRQLRILQISAGLDIGGLSGRAEYFAVRLAQNLDPAQFQSAIFALQLHPTSTVEQLKVQLSNQNIAVFGQSKLFTDLNPANLNILYRSLCNYIDKFQPDIINSHSDRCDLLNLLATRIHARYVHSVQTVHVERQWITKPKFGSLFNHVIAPLCFDAQVVVSEQIRQQLLSRPLNKYLRTNLQMFYNSIDSKWFEESNADLSNKPLPHAMPLAQPRIVTIGRLEEQKGHSYLLQAMNIILQKQLVHLVIVGAGSLEDQLKSQAEQLGLTGYIHFLGHRTDIAQILCHSDLLILASLWEGFPTILLEAMSQGTPIVATAVAGSIELVRNEETGLLIPPRSPDQLAQAILFLLENPEQAKRMAVSAKHYARQYTIDKTATQYSALYSQICHR